MERCREALAERGACELPGFLRPEATDAMAREAAALAPRAHHHTGAATPYLEIPTPDWPEGHPRRRFHPYSLAAVAYDQIPAASPLRALYEWDPLMDFFAAALDKPRLHRYADPLGACNVAVMGDGDELEWHFDQTEFVVSIALQDADEGGDFLYVPRIRSPHEENYEAVARLLRGEIEPQRIPMNPGTLLLFEGEYSIHTVSRCRGATPAWWRCSPTTPSPAPAPASCSRRPATGACCGRPARPLRPESRRLDPRESVLPPPPAPVVDCAGTALRAEPPQGRREGCR